MRCDGFVQLNSDNALDSIIEYLAEFPFKKGKLSKTQIYQSLFSDSDWLLYYRVSACLICVVCSCQINSDCFFLIK